MENPVSCRVQFIDDLDPFESTFIRQPVRAPTITLDTEAPLSIHLSKLHQLLKPPFKINQTSVQVTQSGLYLDNDLSLLEQVEYLTSRESAETLEKIASIFLVLRTHLSYRVEKMIERLDTTQGRALRRSLYQVKCLLDEDNDLIPEFVSTDGLDCLVRLGGQNDEVSPSQQKYVMRAIGQLMLYVDGMSGLAQHTDSLTWLYSRLCSTDSQVQSAALKLLLVFSEYSDENAGILSAIASEHDSWSSVMALVSASVGETSTRSMRLINAVLAAAPDQTAYYNIVDSLEEQGMQRLIANLLHRRQSLPSEFVHELRVYETVLRREDGVSDTEEENSDTMTRRRSRRNSTSGELKPAAPSYVGFRSVSHANSPENTSLRGNKIPLHRSEDVLGTESHRQQRRVSKIMVKDEQFALDDQPLSDSIHSELLRACRQVMQLNDASPSPDTSFTSLTTDNLSAIKNAAAFVEGLPQQLKTDPRYFSAIQRLTTLLHSSPEADPSILADPLLHQLVTSINSNSMLRAQVSKRLQAGSSKLTVPMSSHEMEISKDPALFLKVLDDLVTKPTREGARKPQSTNTAPAGQKSKPSLLDRLRSSKTNQQEKGSNNKQDLSTIESAKEIPAQKLQQDMFTDSNKGAPADGIGNDVNRAPAQINESGLPQNKVISSNDAETKGVAVEGMTGGGSSGGGGTTGGGGGGGSSSLKEDPLIAIAAQHSRLVAAVDSSLPSDPRLRRKTQELFGIVQSANADDSKDQEIQDDAKSITLTLQKNQLVFKEFDFTDLSDSEDEDVLDKPLSKPPNMPAGGVPPVPPPPPPSFGAPPPPPPPAPPKLGDKATVATPRKLMRLHWSEIKKIEAPVDIFNHKRDTIWSQLETLKNFDEENIATLFQVKSSDQALKRRQDASKKEISVLDKKRSEQINIALAKLPPGRTVRHAVLAMDSVAVGREGVELISKLLPTDEETTSIEAAVVSNPETPLATAETFLRLLCGIPNLRPRLEVWLFMLDFESTITKDVAEPILELKRAVNQLASSSTMPRVLATLLRFGNTLHNAIHNPTRGFDVNFLTRVSEIRDTSARRLALIHHVCVYVIDNWPSHSCDLYSELSAVIRVARVDFKEVEAVLGKIETSCIDTSAHVHLICVHESAAFKRRMSAFLATAAHAVLVMKVALRRVHNRFHKLALYYGLSIDAARATNPTTFCKLMTEFAMEYKAAREKILADRAKIEMRKERFKTRGKLITSKIMSSKNSDANAKHVNVDVDTENKRPVSKTVDRARDRKVFSDDTDADAMMDILINHASVPSKSRKQRPRGVSHRKSLRRTQHGLSAEAAAALGISVPTSNA